MPARLTVRLGAIHRQVGVAQEGVSRFVSRAAQGNADAGTRHDLAAVELDRLAERFGNALGHRGQLVHVADIFDQDRELVATKSRGRITQAQAAPQPLGDGQQQLVTVGMSKTVVDHLEVVDVEH